MRIHFQERLAAISTEVVKMSQEAEAMVRLAVESILQNDPNLALQVIAADDEIDNWERKALHGAIATVMQESPVANDLRFLISTLGVVGEIESVADDAVKLARRSRKLVGVFPSSLKISFSEVSGMSRSMFNQAMKLYLDYSDELSQEIIDQDVDVDKAYSRARDQIYEMIKADPVSTEHLIRAIESFHALEHVADRAVAIAKRMRNVHMRITSTGSLEDIQAIV